MYILNNSTEVDILCFGSMELKKILFDFHKKVKTPSCYNEKNLNTPLSFTLKKVVAQLHSALAPLYSKFFKPLTVFIKVHLVFICSIAAKKNAHFPHDLGF